MTIWLASSPRRSTVSRPGGDGDMGVPLRFAIVGCGRVAGNHLDAIARLPRATIAAVCDLDAARAKVYSDAFGTPWYTNYHTMLAAESIDVVSIVTPSGMHPRHAV